ncbi:MAG: hypothetical protein AAF202_11500, partial [Pseudomonadota bacterium]
MIFRNTMLFVLAAVGSTSFAKDYRYKIKPSSVVKETCREEGQTERSRIKIVLSPGKQSRRLASIRLRARVCTSVGFIRFSPRVMLPMSFLDEVQFGDEFDDFTMNFSG